MIKMFEQYNEYSDTEEWLDEMGIKNYIINDDLTVDVNGDINLDFEAIKEFPIQFGTINGSFNASYCSLSTLKGSPIKVMGNFFCDGNRLTSLEYSPKYVSGKFFCGKNDITSLLHLPKNVNCEVIFKPNDRLPSEIKDYYSSSNIIKYQDEYCIWNQDGTFNKARWDMFMKDYETGLLV